MSDKMYVKKLVARIEDQCGMALWSPKDRIVAAEAILEAMATAWEESREAAVDYHHMPEDNPYMCRT